MQAFVCSEDESCFDMIVNPMAMLTILCLITWPGNTGVVDRLIAQQRDMQVADFLQDHATIDDLLPDVLAMIMVCLPTDPVDTPPPPEPRKKRRKKSQRLGAPCIPLPSTEERMHATQVRCCQGSLARHVQTRQVHTR